MAPGRRKILASRHLVCSNFISWVQFESSGCGQTGLRQEGRVLQGMPRGDGFGERNGMVEADGGRHNGECYRNAI